MGKHNRFWVVVLVLLSLVLSTSSALADGPWVPPGVQAGVPCSQAVSSAWLANNVGAPYWSAPSWPDGAWVFRNKGFPVGLRYPGWGSLDVWIGSGPVTVTQSNAYLLAGQSFDEASFHCGGGFVPTYPPPPPPPGYQVNWISSPEQAAQLIGGLPQSWTRPTWGSVTESHEGAWIYHGPPITPRYPGWGRLDIWTPQGVVQVGTITPNWWIAGQTFGDFSFHNNPSDP